MLEKNLSHRYLRNAYLLGIAAASATIGFSSPALADQCVNDTPVVAAKMAGGDNGAATTHTETITVKRKIRFHLPINNRGTTELIQTSHAHRQVTVDPLTKEEHYSDWTIDPFDEVVYPQMQGLAPKSKVPTVKHSPNLSEFVRPIDIFYAAVAEPTAKEMPDTKTQTKPAQKMQAPPSMIDDQESQPATKQSAISEDQTNESLIDNAPQTNAEKAPQDTVPKSSIQAINEQPPLPADIHDRLAVSQGKLARLKTETKTNRLLPQTGNKTSTMTTLGGLSLTIIIALGALFSLKKRR